MRKIIYLDSAARSVDVHAVAGEQINVRRGEKRKGFVVHCQLEAPLVFRRVPDHFEMSTAEDGILLNKEVPDDTVKNNNCIKYH